MATKNSRKKKAAEHDEIWDDSALVDSWNEALEEYQVRLGCRDGNIFYLTAVRNITAFTGTEAL